MRRLSLLALPPLVAACASVPPNTPGVMVLPGSAMSFEQFRADDADCRNYASSQVGGNTPDSAGVDSGLKSAAIGTAVGAAAGAVVGGHRGAATGAGVGLIAGSTAGAAAAGSSSRTLQQRYDIGYTQCMYAKGHKVPVSGRFEAERRSAAAPPPPPPGGTPPPPPPGSPPPPPAR